MDPRITLAGLRQLVALDKHGSLSAVARHLGVSQPTVSSNLARLEEVMGIPLLLRGTTGSTLTCEGAVAVSAARAVIAAADDLARTIEELPQLTTTPLRIAASLTIAEQLVPRWLADSRISNHIDPGQATLKVGNSDAVMSWVEGDDADIGFVEGNRFREGVTHTPIGSDELVAVVGPAHPWFSQRPRIAAADLARSGLVLREPGSGTREVIQDAFAQAGVALPRHHPSFGSTAAILTAVRHGDAVAVASWLAVEDEVGSGALVVLDVADVTFVRNLSAVWRAGALQRADAVELVTNVAKVWGAPAGMRGMS
ncbi:LysR family transcriptional regulator [Microbacterium faecale]|uniref:LysR family transcriptional regulator n=1 Tax=Microbacterium faecale TaxID=1804630 RepID=UPI001669760A|nr:LysR family transcriptional regulator [Microbacterium faecale]